VIFSFNATTANLPIAYCCLTCHTIEPVGPEPVVQDMGNSAQVSMAASAAGDNEGEWAKAVRMPGEFS
jgi:hypothetical protein